MACSTTRSELRGFAEVTWGQSKTIAIQQRIPGNPPFQRIRDRETQQQSVQQQTDEIVSFIAQCLDSWFGKELQLFRNVLANYYDKSMVQ